MTKAHDAMVGRLMPVLWQSGDIPWRARLSNALAALKPGDQLPGGLRVVRGELSAAVCKKLYRDCEAISSLATPEEIQQLWRAMLDASGED